MHLKGPRLCIGLSVALLAVSHGLARHGSESCSIGYLPHEVQCSRLWNLLPPFILEKADDSTIVE